LKREIVLSVNGEEYRVAVAARDTLLEVLRGPLGLTGTKKGCDQGDCGACTVLLDGSPVASCLVLARDARGREVTTIEGLGAGGRLHPVQDAFIRHFATQCGFCTPGMVMAAVGLLGENPQPTEEEVREALAGNLCRCTGYGAIVRAVLDVAAREGGALHA
jgi:carbon-monoxide dehydrogenase small subunit